MVNNLEHASIPKTNWFIIPALTTNSNLKKKILCPASLIMIKKKKINKNNFKPTIFYPSCLHSSPLAPVKRAIYLYTPS